MTRRFGGTGLGLAISHRLTELMGGRIGITSEIDKGSTFWFSIPLPETQREPSVEFGPEPVDLHGIRVLVVDDNRTNRHILRTYLEKWGCTVAEAVSGAEALLMLRDAVSRAVLSEWRWWITKCPKWTEKRLPGPSRGTRH